MADFGPLITSKELAAALARRDLVVIDCRFDLADPGAGRRLWLDSHIPGAVFLDLEQDLSAKVSPLSGRHPLPDADELRQAFRRCGINNGSRVVVYDASHGGIASRAWWLLKALGHEAVALLERGFTGWQQGGHAVESGEVSAGSEGNFDGSPALLRRNVVATEQIEADLGSLTAPPLVDARERHRYRGEREPIDAVAGRVPGALNLPFLELMEPDGKFHAKPVLRRQFAALLGEDPDKPWTAMCGSGVTACHLAVAADVAGLARPSIYVGSFSEWIRNPDRPVHSG